LESITPEPVEISAYALDAGRVQLIDAAISDLVIENQVSVFKYA
jgi:hypothetical protein